MPGIGRVKPARDEAMRRLRIDDDLAEDVGAAIDQAHAETERYLDGRLYASADDLEQANDARGIVCTADIIAAQLLLVDAIVNSNSDEGADLKRARAFDILRSHRNQGA